MNIYYAAGLLSTAFGGVSSGSRNNMKFTRLTYPLSAQLLAYAIGHMDNVAGYNAWRWIFIIEGLFTIVVAVFSFFVLPDWPEQARHLTEHEQRALLQKLARDTREYVEERSTRQVLNDCLKDPKVYFRFVKSV